MKNLINQLRVLKKVRTISIKQSLGDEGASFHDIS